MLALPSQAPADGCAFLVARGVPPGKIVIRSPLPTAIKGVTVNGKAIEAFAPDEAVIGEFPADVVLRY